MREKYKIRAPGWKRKGRERDGSNEKRGRKTWNYGKTDGRQEGGLRKHQSSMKHAEAVERALQSEE